MKIPKLVILLICISTLVAASSLALAERSPKQVVDESVKAVRSTVQKEKEITPENELDDKLKKIIYPVFDFEEMAKRCLGPHWNKATQDEQKEFVALFSNLLARTYLKKIRENVEESKVNVLSELQRGSSVLVKTSVETEKDKVAIDYSMCKANPSAQEFRVCDVIIENVGLVSNYRSEFAGIVRKEQFAGLLKRLREKQ